MFEKVLLTLDHSVFAEAAIPSVIALEPASVVVIQVADSVPSVLSYDMPAFDVPADIAEQIRAGERHSVEMHLDDVAGRLRAAGLANVTTLTLEGRPGPRIVETAAELGCDVVVMSTHGRSGVKRAFLGSVAGYVVNHIENAAVLLVRPRDVPSA